VKGEGEVGLKKEVSWYSNKSNEGGSKEGITTMVINRGLNRCQKGSKEGMNQ
jgi:hypothetical protein